MAQQSDARYDDTAAPEPESSRALVPIGAEKTPDRSRGFNERDFSEFLPDSQSIVEKSHSPAVRLLMAILVCVSLGMIGYISIAEVEQVSTAKGVVRPADRVKVINHPQGGAISAIFVKEGDRVEEGQALLEFNAELTQEEVDKLRADLQQFQAQMARLQAEADGSEPDFPSDLEAERPDIVAAQLQLFNARREALSSRVSSSREIAAQREQSIAALETRINQQEETLGILREQASRVRTLVDSGHFPELRYLSILRQISEESGALEETRANLAGARASLEEARTNLDSIERTWQADVLAELAEVMADLDRAQNTLDQQSANLRNLVLYAPTEGYVQDLAIANLGQSVRPSDELMKIVPVGDSLVIEATLRNEDIGFVYVGQPATVKIDTYDFTKFGELEGTIEAISADSEKDERTGLFLYTVTVRTNKTYLGATDTEQPVIPGMQTTVDILIGKRTILAFLTDRLRQTAATAFNQR